MDWSNEMVIEFLHHFETEPVIWNPKHDQHKKKHAVFEAWHRIMNNISWHCSVEDLKKKRDSLMAYYRIHSNKIKKSKAAGEEGYKTSWFAFDTMHGFLGEIYECTTPANNEQTYAEKRAPRTPESVDSGSLIEHQYPPAKRRAVEEFEEFVPNTHGNESVDIRRSQKRTTECQLYGDLLAQKLMKLGEDDRLVLMNDIDNLVFRKCMEAKARVNNPHRCDVASNQILCSKLTEVDTIQKDPIKIEITEEDVN